MHNDVRTTIVLDESTRSAARELAQHYDCSMSEAIRRAVAHERDRVAGVSAEFRARRRRALQQLFALFEGHDADAEIRALKREDDGF
jgi:hypothetical protein